MAFARLFANAATWAQEQGRDVIRNAPKPTRGGVQLTFRQFGELIGWGTGEAAARSLLRRLQEMARGSPAGLRAYIDQLRQAGVTAEMAAKWAEGYRLAASMTPTSTIASTPSG